MKSPMWAGGDARFPLGTDDLGRDMLSRLAYGARISLGFGFLSVVVSVLIGGALGLRPVFLAVGGIDWLCAEWMC